MCGVGEGTGRASSAVSVAEAAVLRGVRAVVVGAASGAQPERGHPAGVGGRGADPLHQPQQAQLPGAHSSTQVPHDTRCSENAPCLASGCMSRNKEGQQPADLLVVEGC